MKKTSVIILTLVASLAIGAGDLQGNPIQDIVPQELAVESDAGADLTRSDTIRSDTVRRDTVRRDTVMYYQQNVYYDYCYRNRFLNSMFRIFWPRRYYAIINRPGYVPRHLRRSDRLSVAAQGVRPFRSSSTGRAGFGKHGSGRGARS